jgi:hypothetical protein
VPATGNFSGSQQQPPLFNMLLLQSWTSTLCYVLGLHPSATGQPYSRCVRQTL